MTEEQALRLQVELFRHFPLVETLVALERDLAANKQFAKETLSSLRNPLLWLTAEMSICTLGYLTEQRLDVLALLPVLKIATAAFPGMLSRNPSQEDPLLAPWKQRLAEIQAQRPIDKPIHFKIGKDEHFGCLGFAYGNVGDILICLSSTQKLSDEEAQFVLGHEYGHALNNDQLKTALYVLLAQTVVGGLFTLSASPETFQIVTALQFSLLATMVRCGVEYLHHNALEANADRTAFSLEPKEKRIKGAIRFFESTIQKHQHLRRAAQGPLLERLWFKLAISPGGNNLLDLDHPLLTTRLKAAKKALAALPKTEAPKKTEDAASNFHKKNDDSIE